MKEKAGESSENGDLRRQPCISVGAMNIMNTMPGQKHGGVGFGLFVGKVQDRKWQLPGCCSVIWT
ncbi:hypothetical protein [Hungatella hathewayi]|uniref:hypothetical protein n=1 Tax=Hungatella hathewayi TaxID=154046 RepID=UPI003565B7BB